jgi:hypothetical protein
MSASAETAQAEGDQSWTYTQFNHAWPVTPRDSVLHVTTVRSDGSLTRNLKEEPSICRKKGLCACCPGAGFLEAGAQG